MVAQVSSFERYAARSDTGPDRLRFNVGHYPQCRRHRRMEGGLSHVSQKFTDA